MGTIEKVPWVKDAHGVEWWNGDCFECLPDGHLWRVERSNVNISTLGPDGYYVVYKNMRGDDHGVYYMAKKGVEEWKL